MVLKMGWFNRSKGSKPAGKVPILYGYDHPQHDYQVKWTYPWPEAPARESRAALTNCWTGNQMPGYTNFIPAVALSNVSWLHSTSYMNTLDNQQYNVGYNIMVQTSVENAILTQMVQQAWQNRMGYALG